MIKLRYAALGLVDGTIRAHLRTVRPVRRNLQVRLARLVLHWDAAQFGPGQIAQPDTPPTNRHSERQTPGRW